MQSKPALFEDFEGWVEEHGGRTVPVGDKVAVMPTEYFEDEDLPDVDPMPATVEKNGKPVLEPPLVWLHTQSTGVQLLSADHIAYAWRMMSPVQLLEEFRLRREFNHQIPPVVTRAVNRNVGGWGAVEVNDDD